VVGLEGMQSKEDQVVDIVRAKGDPKI